MTDHTALTRRAAFATAAGAAALLAAGPGRAAAPMQGALRASVRRFRLGAFEVTTIHDGSAVQEGPHPTYGENQPAEAVAELARANLLPVGQVQSNFTVTLVNTGAALILFDTGNGAARRPDAGLARQRLAEAGVSPEQIDIVVITHFHGDHINGLMEDGAAAYPNARYVTGAVENNFWTGADAPEPQAANAARMVVPLAERTTFVDPGYAVVSGVEAVEAFGHSPGHMAWHLESEGARLLILADTATHFVMAMQRPDWHVRFDRDKEAAAAARRRILGMIAADRIPFVGYHMPPPAVGYLEPMGEGFRYVPESYQLSL